MENQRMLYNDLESILYTKQQLAEAVAKLGERITHDYQGKKPVMICILKGASVFFCDLIRQIDLPLEMDFMVVSSYGASTKSSGEVRLVKDLDRSVLGRDVIIVEDIVDSGMTLNFLKRTLTSRGAASLRIATLLDKPARRRVPLTEDYSCFDIPDAFVVGYGLDYDEVYRNLPDIGVLSPRIYEGKEYREGGRWGAAPNPGRGQCPLHPFHWGFAPRDIEFVGFSLLWPCVPNWGSAPKPHPTLLASKHLNPGKEAPKNGPSSPSPSAQL